MIKKGKCLICEDRATHDLVPKGYEINGELYMGRGDSLLSLPVCSDPAHEEQIRDRYKGLSFVLCPRWFPM
jgi:hypothetical protein